MSQPDLMVEHSDNIYKDDSREEGDLLDMAFLVVPHQVTGTSATVWVGALGEGDVKEKSIVLDVEADGADASDSVELNAGTWRTWQTFERSDPNGFERIDRLLHKFLSSGAEIRERIHYQRIELTDLHPNAQYKANLVAGGEEATGTDGRLGSCSFRTLPNELPEAGSGDTFNVLLGSCFYRPRDPHGMVGRTFAELPEGYRPHVKILCGDQVYLDNPWPATTLKWNWSYRQPGAFKKMLLDKYLDTWTQSPDDKSGYNRLLSEGANYFCSDDHEFWNNAPSFGGVGLANTISPGRRSWWFEEARKLFRVFQARSSLQDFKVGDLSVKIVDTRIDRDTAGIRFMLYENLEEVRDWLSSLKGPGVLVLGQPLLQADKTETLMDSVKSLFDKDLADFGQYSELREAILNCPHSLVVFTGDIHCGRVASTRPNSEGVTDFVEIVASPTCLVPDFFGRRENKRCDAALPLDSRPLISKDPFEGSEPRDHFATIQFSSLEGKRMQMRVTYWPIQRVEEGPAPGPMEPFEFTLS